jgi:hypothetical protein
MMKILVHIMRSCCPTGMVSLSIPRENGKSTMSNHFPKRSTFSQLACLAVLFCTFGAVTTASAQPTEQDRMHNEQYAHAQRMNELARQQWEENARQQQEANARRNQGDNSQPYEPPAQFREPQNHGALSWYRKANNEMGYVFVQGLVSRVSAEVQIDMECRKRGVQCIPDLKRVVTNSWVLIGSQPYNGTDMLSVAIDPSREQAEVALQQTCAQYGSRCTVKEAFAVLPHRKGIRFQPFRVVVW